MPTPPVRVTSYYRHVDPDLAQQWLENHLFDRQRRLRPHRVAQLAQIMRQGLFREGTPLSFAMVNGTRYLVNGQHTLHAIIASGKTLRLAIEDHQCATMADVADLYTSFDIQMRRTGNDLFTAYDFATEHTMTTNMIDALSGAISIIIGGFLGVTRGKDHPCNLFLSSPHNKRDAMALWADPGRAYLNTFQYGVPAYIKWQAHRSMVAAVGILTFRYQPVAAKEFWTRIALREHLSRTMPEYALANYLAPVQASSLRQGFIYSRGVAAAWNAAFQGRTLAHIKPRESQLPILIAGTPFDGKRELMYFRPGTETRPAQLSWYPVEVVKESPCEKAENVLPS